METKTFLLKRWEWAKETAGWLGVILLIGFIRVNFLGASINADFPEYKSHTILGAEIPDEDSPRKHK